MGSGGFTLKDERPVRTYEITWRAGRTLSGRAFIEAPGPSDAIAQARLLELDDPADTAVAAKALGAVGSAGCDAPLDVRLDP